MDARLIPLEPLSQVCFVHDYVQLVFQDEGINIYNRALIQIGSVRVVQGESRFLRCARWLDRLTSRVDTEAACTYPRI